jgi:hypothetical protein
MAEYRVIGIYSISPTDESLSAAARYHGFEWLVDETGKYQGSYSDDDFIDLVLVELQVDGQFSVEDFDTISQDDQAPYMEFYLDAYGMQLLSESEVAEQEKRRVCFFLHFADTEKPLRIGETRLEFTRVSPIPERLRPFTHYLPVD